MDAGHRLTDLGVLRGRGGGAEEISQRTYMHIPMPTGTDNGVAVGGGQQGWVEGGRRGRIRDLCNTSTINF